MLVSCESKLLQEELWSFLNKNSSKTLRYWKPVSGQFFMLETLTFLRSGNLSKLICFMFSARFQNNIWNLISNLFRSSFSLKQDFELVFSTQKLLVIFDNRFFFFSVFVTQEQCRIQTFFGSTVFQKLRIGQFSHTQKRPIVVAKCSKIFDVQCIWGGIFVSPEKISIFKNSQAIFHLVFT